MADQAASMPCVRVSRSRKDELSAELFPGLDHPGETNAAEFSALIFFAAGDHDKDDAPGSLAIRQGGQTGFQVEQAVAHDVIHAACHCVAVMPLS